MKSNDFEMPLTLLDCIVFDLALLFYWRGLNMP